MRRTTLALALLVLVGCSAGGAGTDGPDVPTAEDVRPTDATQPEDVVPPVDAATAPDVATDAGHDAPAPDAGPPSPWEGLAGSGPDLNHIVGVASQMNTHAEPNAQRDFEYAQYAPYPGFRMRNGLRFDDVEPERGVWDFDSVRGAVDGAVAVGARALIALDYGVAWAQEGDLHGTVDIDAYAEYAGRMAAEFCDESKEYEIWNEQNLARFWAPAPDPERYGRLLAAASAAIHAACPDATVLFGGMSSYADGPGMFDTWGFLREALAVRPELCDAFDAVALHPYTFFQYDPPEHDERVNPAVTVPSQTSMVRIAREILADAGCAPKPLYFTEVGWPSYDLSEETVARYAIRSLLLTARDGVAAWCWYTFWDFDPVTEGVRPHEHYFGMFGWVGLDGTARRPKPSWEAVTTALGLLGDARFARDLAPALGAPDDVYVLAFTDDEGRVTLALWDGREDPDVTADGPTEGGPDTTYALALPLPEGVTATTLFDQYGAPLASPGTGPVVHLTLGTAVQYLRIR